MQVMKNLRNVLVATLFAMAFMTALPPAATAEEATDFQAESTVGMRAETDDVISIDASGEITLTLSDDGSYSLAGAITKAGSYNASTSIQMAADQQGTLTIQGTGLLAGARLMEWDYMTGEIGGFDLVIAENSSVTFGDTVDCMNLSVYGALRSHWSYVGDEQRPYAVGCFGSMLVDGGVLEAVVESDTSLHPVVLIDSGYLFDYENPKDYVLPQSRIMHGGRLSITMDGEDAWGTLLSVAYNELVVADGSLSLRSLNGSYAYGYTGTGDRLTVDGGSVVVETPLRDGIQTFEMKLGSQGSVRVNAGYNGVNTKTLQIGSQDNPSAATIDIESTGQGLNVTRATNVFGAGRDNASITVRAGAPDEYGLIGAELRRAHIANTKVSVEAVSGRSTGLLLAWSIDDTPPMRMQTDFETYENGQEEQVMQVAFVENATIVANGTEAGLQMESSFPYGLICDRFRFVDSDVTATASGVESTLSSSPLISLPMYPSSAILNNSGTYYIENTAIEADGGDYGWLSMNYQQPVDHYAPLDGDDEEYDYENTRMYASNNAKVTVAGDIAGIAIAGSLEATSGADVIGISRLTDVYASEPTDVPAVQISNYLAGKNDIRADGGTVTEQYLVPISDPIADNEADAFNPYAAAWHMASPAHYVWTADRPEVQFAASDSGVYTVSGMGSAETGLSITATRTASEAGEKVVVGSDGSAHKVVLVGDIKAQDPLRHRVQFEPNGGAPKPADQMVAHGSSAVEPAGDDKPQRSGYSLEGWYTDKGLTTKWSFDDPVTGDMTLYAKWVEEQGPTPPGPIDPDPEHPGPIDPEPIEPQPIDVEPVDPKPVQTGGGLVRVGDGFAVPLALGALLLVAFGVGAAWLGLRRASRSTE